MNNLRKKILGCWLGKAVGGTLGQPYEGCDGPLNLSFYEPVPDDMIPNDDLDLQVLWACVMDEMEKPEVNRDIFAEAWVNKVEFPWDEYGVAIRNLRKGIPAPFSGSFDNWFSNGLGAAIRSELWACLAVGEPELAAAYAYEDACVDHAGDGIWAEVFLAALESIAFVGDNIKVMIERSLMHIPDESILKSAIRDTLKWCNEINGWLDIRNEILDKYGSENFTDVIMNLCFIVLGLVKGEGEFDKSLCITVNCGLDADCTTASVGAIMGIMNPDCISEKWLKPIGRKLVINDEIIGINPPATIDDFTDLVIDLKSRLGGKYPSAGKEKFNLKKYQIKVKAGFIDWFAQDNRLHLNSAPKMPDNTKEYVFSGTMGELPASIFPPDKILLMKYRINLKVSQEVNVMFNTHENCRVWIDGEYAFGREMGRMAPSFHRVPVNQQAVLNLDAGEHEIVVGIAPSSGKEKMEWIIGIGDAQTNQWLTDAFV
jgi:ADP-ribosylglycohydrolase